MNIRPARQSDLSSVSLIWYERITLLQQTDSYFTLLPDAMQVWERQAADWIEDMDVGFYVADQDETNVGFVVVTQVDGPVGLRPTHLGKIVDMGLDLHRSHRGLAGSLVGQASEWLRDRDIRLLTVDLPARYPVEEAFWRSVGAKLRFNKFWMAI